MLQCTIAQPSRCLCNPVRNCTSIHHRRRGLWHSARDSSRSVLDHKFASTELLALIRYVQCSRIEIAVHCECISNLIKATRSTRRVGRIRVMSADRMGPCVMYCQGLSLLRRCIDLICKINSSIKSSTK